MSPKITCKVIESTKKNAAWLIMVHGFTHNSKYFSAQIPIFMKHFHLCLINLRGHGESSNVPGPFGVEEYADDIFEVLDELKIEQACFWGTHTGAAIALIMALRQPQRFSRLALEGTFLPGFPMPRVGELINRARTIVKEKGLEAARLDWFNHADWFDVIRANPQACRAAAHLELVQEFWGAPWLSDLKARPVTPAADHLHQIEIPVLIYNGENDLKDFRRAADFMAKKLPHAQQVIIPHGGGFPAWEFPEQVNERVLSFLNNE
jgi:pimeloyl-ACP methyl ester carboxylesterase